MFEACKAEMRLPQLFACFTGTPCTPPAVPGGHKEPQPVRVNLRHSNEDVDAARQGSDVCAPALGQVDSKYCRLRRQATDEDNDCGAVDNVSISSVSCRESSRGSPIHGCAHGEAVLTAALKQANASRHLRACSTRAAGYEGSSHSHACPGSWAGMEREWHDYQHQHAGPSLYPTEISPTSVVSPSASGRLFNIQAWEGLGLVMEMSQHQVSGCGSVDGSQALHYHPSAFHQADCQQPRAANRPQLMFNRRSMPQPHPMMGTAPHPSVAISGGHIPLYQACMTEQWHGRQHMRQMHTQMGRQPPPGVPCAPPMHEAPPHSGGFLDTGHPSSSPFALGGPSMRATAASLPADYAPRSGVAPLCADRLVGAISADLQGLAISSGGGMQAMFNRPSVQLGSRHDSSAHSGYAYYGCGVADGLAPHHMIGLSPPTSVGASSISGRSWHAAKAAAMMPKPASAFPAPSGLEGHPNTLPPLDEGDCGASIHILPFMSGPDDCEVIVTDLPTNGALCSSPLLMQQLRTAGANSYDSIGSAGCAAGTSTPLYMHHACGSAPLLQGGGLSTHTTRLLPIAANGSYPSTTLASVPAMPLQCVTLRDVGCQLSNISFLGAGAGGSVYKAMWRDHLCMPTPLAHTGAPAAAKFVVTEAADNLTRSAHEAVLSRAIAHPNLVQTFFAGLVFLAHDDFVAGSTMASPLDDGEAFGLFSHDFGEGGICALSSRPSLNQDHGSHISRCNSLRPTLSGNRLIRPQDQSIYNSQDGFGDPDPDRNLCSNWAACGEFDHESWVKLLTTLHATPGTYLTVIVMELCDRGSLAGAIHKGLFDCGDLGLAPVPGLSPIPPPASGPTANSTNEYSFSHRLTRSTKGGAAGARGGTMGGVQCSPEGPRITLRALLRTAREIALGMHHMHCDKLVHGDLKPGNILLKSSRADRRGFIAKVSDFGLSRVTRVAGVSGEHGTTAVLMTEFEGTPCYMAPEAMEGTLMPASDVWSFGMLLYQMVCGEGPFTDMHHAQIISCVQSDQVQLEWPGHVHPEVRRLAHACIQHDAKKRPSFKAIVKKLTKIEQEVRQQKMQAEQLAQAGPLMP